MGIVKGTSSQTPHKGILRIAQGGLTDSVHMTEEKHHILGPPQRPPRVAWGPLTLIVDEEANTGAAAVCGEEQVHVLPRADEELWRLGAMVLADQRGGAGWSVPDFQSVIIDFCLESGKHGQKRQSEQP